MTALERIRTKCAAVPLVVCRSIWADDLRFCDWLYRALLPKDIKRLDNHARVLQQSTGGLN